MKKPYELIGGEEGVKRLAKEFYAVMSSRSGAKTIRDMHAADTRQIEEKLYMFLSGWMGGPDLYFEQHGTVCLTKPHASYAIGSEERDQWIACMDQALENTGASEELKAMIKKPMFAIADMMRNKL